jgi:drug/metabolite transporter (DMT)-like permease
MSAAYRHAPAAVLAPLDYTAMVWAVLLGAVLFGDIPGPPVVIGSIIIILSGLWLIRGRRG